MERNFRRGEGRKWEAVTSDLVQRARRGDLDAFDELVAEHERRVWGLANQILRNADDARDVTQDVFLRVHRHLRGYDARRPFAAWLYRITVNCSYDFLKKRPSFVSLDALPVDHSPVLADEKGVVPSATTHTRELRAALRRSLGGLTRQERTVFILRDIEGLSTRDIGYILRCSTITVRRHSSSARLKLREALAAAFSPDRGRGEDS
ncbi:MAG: RNA polymerase sigma factor [Acidobacteriota bacterium]